MDDEEESEQEADLEGADEQAEHALNISAGEWLNRAKAVQLTPADILRLLASGIIAFVSEVETRERQNSPPITKLEENQEE